MNGKASKAKKKGASRQGQPKRGARVVTGVDHYMRMIEDPCSSELAAGFYGSVEGYLARFHSILTPGGNTSDTCGYLLWVPEFHNRGYIGAAEAKWNLIMGTLNSPTTGIDLSGYATGQEARQDPCYQFVSGTVCGDARTLSACGRMSYYGTLSNNQGMVAHVDIPFSVLEDKLAGGGLSVDDLFKISQDVRRTSLDPMEQKYAPLGAEPTFKSDGGNSDGDYGIHDTSGVISVGTSAKVLNPRVIGFAWKGYSPLSSTGAFPFQFDLYKNIEWRPQSTSGLTIPVPRRIASGNNANRVVAMLDAIRPGWKTSTHAVMKSAGARITERALAYGSSALVRAAPGIAGFLL